MLEEIIMERDVVLLRNLVMKEKETATDLVMEVLMMVMLGARETSSVVPTIVNYLATIIIRRTIVARGPTGLSGAVSVCAVWSVDMGRRPGPEGVLVPSVERQDGTFRRHRREFVLALFVVLGARADLLFVQFYCQKNIKIPTNYKQ